MADGAAGEQANRKCHDVVASDHTHFGESFFGTNFDLRSYSAHRSRNRSAGHGRENLNGGISRQHTDRTPPSGASQIGPEDVAPGYQFGIVSLAKRAATSTTMGSWGVKRYDAWSSASDLRSSSASSTATAPLRRSSDRLVPRSAASRSSRATRSSSNCTSTSRRPTRHMVTHMSQMSRTPAVRIPTIALERVNQKVWLPRGVEPQSRSLDQTARDPPES
jgi:hypothetical protein